MAIHRWLRDRDVPDKRRVYAALVARTAKKGMPVNEDLARNALHTCSGDIGRAPSRAEYDRWRSSQDRPGDWPSATFIRSAFGGWINALGATGLAPIEDVGSRGITAIGPAFSEQELIVALRACASAVGRGDPSRKRYRAWAFEALATDPGRRVPRHPNTFLRSFGSWFDALHAAGLTPSSSQRGGGQQKGEKEVLAALAEAHEELGPSRLTINGYEAWRFRQIARDQDARNRLPRARTIGRRFGSWKAAVAKLGSRKEHGER